MPPSICFFSLKQAFVDSVTCTGCLQKFAEPLSFSSHMKIDYQKRSCAYIERDTYDSKIQRTVLLCPVTGIFLKKVCSSSIIVKSWV